MDDDVKDGNSNEAPAVLDLARNWFDTRTVETVFEPLVEWPIRAHLIAVWLPIVVLAATAVRGKSGTDCEAAPASRRV